MLRSASARPVAGPGEVLIRVSASGVNRPDVLQRKGTTRCRRAPRNARASKSPARSSAATRDAMAAAGFKLGDRVCALVAGGGYAELCVAPVGQCLPVPEGLSDVEAASLPETFFTVWSNVFDRARLQPGETLLVQGGTSGIGVTAIQLAKALRRHGDRHRRQRRQVRGLPGARRRPRHQLQDAGLRRRGASASPAAAASTWSSTWSPATTSRARSSAWPTTAAS